MSKFTETLKTFPRTFWVSNTMELFERWAWYGMFAVLAIYITESTETGALGFTQAEKGTIMGSITGILYLLPVITGSIADKFGYKKVLLVAYAIMASAYYLLGQFNTYYAFYATFLLLAIGAALFKPVISASVAKTTNKTNASIGFGIFYMMVNVGGFIGPFAASKVRNLSWDYVFIMSSCAIAINILLVLFFYKEPDRKKSKEPLTDAILQTLSNIVEGLKDIKLVLLLVIIVGFWTMFNQIFYTLPNFIVQWVDTTQLYDAIHNISPALASVIGNDKGEIPQEMIINVDAGMIVLFQVAVSAFVMRFKPLNAMIGGILVCGIGVGASFFTNNPFYIVLGIMIFAFGEMSSSPKFTEYIGSIAPKGKEALYMGMSYLPVAVGNILAGYFSGTVYEKYSDKISLVARELDSKGIEIESISKSFTKTDYLNSAAEKLGMSQDQLTQHIWDTYNPSKIWYIFAGIGALTVLMLFIYDRVILKKSN
ncbi:MFS transporter [Aureibacter tunicatorum]|uniref:Dipeptide/tripeptide permease n=1 Tax=Aureibacter tunicatorum TaxID=866807 RepID=A0AAE3XMC7_9BACT|nr:MFS transporter [Aureibacter tunicatorum]MDR6238426.1 dipeptide/tripeptide permease [Aureibacter tunicatorum]BDD03458.1 MFS transporter [Aureibacter tunicatorum]